MSKFKVSQQQKSLILENKSRYVLFHGGRGGGKTTAVCLKAVLLASKPGTRVGIFRKKLQDLQNTLLRTLLDGDGQTPPILPKGSYEHNKQTRTISIIGGGEIIYNGLDNGDVSREVGSTGKGSGLNLTAAIFDEAIQISEADFGQIDFAVRMDIDADNPPQSILVCNPSSPNHWIAKKFNINGNDPDDHKKILINLDDNPFITDRVKKSLKAKYTGVFYDRYILGKWVGAEGLVYEDFDPNIHLIDTKPAPDTIKRIILGVDDGVTEAFACLRGDLDSNDVLYITQCFHKSNHIQRNKIQTIREMANNDYEKIIIDSAAADLIQSCQADGLNVTGAKKGQGSVLAGIQKINDRIKTNRLLIHRDCAILVDEMMSYYWNTSGGLITDQPIQKNDHALDALRYMVLYLDGIKFESNIIMDLDENEITEDLFEVVDSVSQDEQMDYFFDR